MRYRTALKTGFEQIKQSEILALNHLLKIHQELEFNNAGFRKQAGTTLKNQGGEIIYAPPQDPQIIQSQMNDLEKLINDEEFALQGVDPLIKNA